MARPSLFFTGRLPPAALTLLAACALAACQRVAPPTPSAAGPAPEPPPAVVPAAYTPPGADALYQMVAPIALYPDKLVAQVLAGATYPDQITAAEGWLAQNPALKGDALANAAESQPWDPSVKSLTAFPNVLEQMASNLPWTTALGKAYYHDPADVMNAIQVLRARAARAGTLQSSPRLRVATVAGSALPPPPPATLPVEVFQGPVVVAPPPTVITIEPTEVQTVYVPRYDPQVVFGTPVPLYSGYRWAAPVVPMVPVAVAAGPDPVAVGVLAFGAGVLVGALAGHGHHAWGWDAWNVHWGGPPPQPVAWGPAPAPAWRPAVVYRGTTYVSQSPTVIENIHNHITVNHRDTFYAAPSAPPLPGPVRVTAEAGGAPAMALAGGMAAPARPGGPPHPVQGVGQPAAPMARVFAPGAPSPGSAAFAAGRHAPPLVAAVPAALAHVPVALPHPPSQSTLPGRPAAPLVQAVRNAPGGVPPAAVPRDAAHPPAGPVAAALATPGPFPVRMAAPSPVPAPPHGSEVVHAGPGSGNAREAFQARGMPMPPVPMPRPMPVEAPVARHEPPPRPQQPVVHMPPALQQVHAAPAPQFAGGHPPPQGGAPRPEAHAHGQPPQQRPDHRHPHGDGA